MRTSSPGAEGRSQRGEAGLWPQVRSRATPGRPAPRPPPRAHTGGARGTPRPQPYPAGRSPCAAPGVPAARDFGASAERKRERRQPQIGGDAAWQRGRRPRRFCSARVCVGSCPRRAAGRDERAFCVRRAAALAFHS